MLIRLLVACHGRGIGDEIDVPEDEAVRLFSGRWAIPALPRMERAVVADQAIERRAKKRK